MSKLGSHSQGTSVNHFLHRATSPASFLRLMFHDCQVQGFDASILLDSEGSEMVSSKNFGIRNQEKIQVVEAALEAVCPGQVSCADIIALVAKESVAFAGGPEIRIPLGRKDSRTSSHQQANIHLPSPGAHTLRAGHCINIVDRLYDPNSRYQINHSFELLLRLTCPTKTPLTNLTIVPNDMAPFVFDNRYYRDIMVGRALFGFNSSISRDPRTASIVDQFALDQNHFFQAFPTAFVRLSLTNVLRGAKGEVRRTCKRVNM